MSDAKIPFAIRKADQSMVVFAPVANKVLLQDKEMSMFGIFLMIKMPMISRIKHVIFHFTVVAGSMLLSCS
jgi:hypothetical protein